MKLLIAAIATLITFGFAAFNQDADAFNPQVIDEDTPVVEVLPWLPNESDLLRKWARESTASTTSTQG